MKQFIHQLTACFLLLALIPLTACTAASAGNHPSITQGLKPNTVCSSPYKAETVADAKEAALPVPSPDAVLFVFELNGKQTSITLAQFQGLPQADATADDSNGNEAQYTGVRWADLASFFGLDPDHSLIIEAGNGFSIVLKPDELNDPQSLFAVRKNDRLLPIQNGGSIAFRAPDAYPAETRVDGIVKITVY